MLIRPRVRELAVMLAAAIAAGCAGPGPSAPGPGTPGAGGAATENKVPAVAPPTAVPRVSARNVTGGRGEDVGVVVYRSWVVDGALQQDEQARLPEPAGPPSVGPGQGIVVTVDTPIEPVRIDVVTYRGAGADGMPEQKLTETACPRGPGGGPCAYDVGERVVLRADVDRGSTILVVNAGWHVPAEVRAAHPSWPSEMSAAWLFRLAAA